MVRCEEERDIGKLDKSRKRRKVLQDMKPFTKSRSPDENTAPKKKKRKQGTTSVKDKKLGWFYSGHRFMQEKCLEIKRDREKGKYEDFECIYRGTYGKIEEEEEDGVEERFTIDKDTMWQLDL